MSNQNLNNFVEEAASTIGKTWPLYSFVTSNPLSGYEGIGFENAIQEAKKYIGGSPLPTGSMFRQAWEGGEFDRDILHEMLTEAGFFQQPEYYLKEMGAIKAMPISNAAHKLDRIVTKWLCAFIDEGMAEWEMPGRSKGFFGSWRKLAVYDQEIGITAIAEIPETADEALSQVLAGYSKAEQLDIFKCHIAALPGWTGYIKYRMTEGSPWRHKCPVTLKDYLAVRLWIAKHINHGIIAAPAVAEQNSELSKLQFTWLKAWERSWQKQIAARLNKSLTDLGNAPNAEKDPAVQLVFCIDTRSELIRRHIESKGDYETFGYAGFFGIATDYQDLTSGLIRKSCPPILSSAYTIHETPLPGKIAEVAHYERKKSYLQFADFLSARMKNMLPSAFGYVEGTGLFYGGALLWRTLSPGFSKGSKDAGADAHEAICGTEIYSNSSKVKEVIPLEEKVAIVRSAFVLLGWKSFAPLVVFTGHGSHSANNPFGSSLDCGACAASPGRHNARMLARLANLPDVRNALSKEFAIEIPDTTFFMGAEHNTATDEIILFDADVPESHRLITQRLKADLSEISQSAITERLGNKKGAKIARKKSDNWAETRPEWGLAGNAGFIIAPRKVTRDINLGSRCFLHSYDWQADDQGLSLEMIMQGPMVVTQWINNHYYFSTVDNDRFGGGSKITHNVTGRFGVVQGNGGDLKTGLPLQSVNSSDQGMFHQPLRLSVIIQSPLARIEEILLRNNQLKQLIDNEWIYLMVMDPLAENQIRIYQKNGDWPLLANEKMETSAAVKSSIITEGNKDYFKGRKLVIATMHGKEKVLAPILETSLGVVTVLPEGFNTDIYGTFSGEVEREMDPLETARIKCIDACKKSGCTLAVSSEGSFGAHPTMLYVPADDEIMVLMDMENDIYVRARVVSTKTNFNGNKFNDWDSAREFAERVKFPSHGLIIKNEKRSDVIKGIHDWISFERYFEEHLRRYGTVFLETDMRAMYNPLRMEVIAEVAAKLVETVLRECPLCNFPGYDISQINKGLPCGQCGLPTESILSYLYECKKCSYSSIKYYPNAVKTEDPRYCNFCNP